ncbi:unnamed protein product [marine sediment metagenome]|uniref:Ribbon-helix-helix protein CopG domain-containing protein n=1 Tax=marine sediment metagenome TaxID=412755 RepID=X1L128_9ZZZZ
MGKIYLATRLERRDFDEIERLVKQSKLDRAEVTRRLILIGLKHVREPKDLLKA